MLLDNADVIDTDLGFLFSYLYAISTPMQFIVFFISVY